jgi:hypothetical protein
VVVVFWLYMSSKFNTDKISVDMKVISSAQKYRVISKVPPRFPISVVQ